MTFQPEHGCGDSPTVGVRVQAPVADAAAGEVDGWTATATPDGAGNTVLEWTGGCLPADEAGAFPVELTVPDAVGTLLAFPAVQRCANGEELAWIGTRARRRVPGAAGPRAGRRLGAGGDARRRPGRRTRARAPRRPRRRASSPTTTPPPRPPTAAPATAAPTTTAPPTTARRRRSRRPRPWRRRPPATGRPPRRRRLPRRPRRRRRRPRAARRRWLDRPAGSSPSASPLGGGIGVAAGS